MTSMTAKRLAVATLTAIAAGTLAVAVATSSPVEAAVSTVDVVGPAGSGRFGEFVVVLPNGNFVVEDSEWDSPTAQDVGAVSLFDGRTNTLISTLTGSNPNDRVGITGIQVVGGSNFVVRSPLWRNGGAEQAGAATWVNGQTGLSGLVGSANSLVGSSDFDQVGLNVVPLTNGHYVVYSVVWDNLSPAVADVGAATWGNGLAGTKGVVTSGNSLVGTKGLDLNAGSVVPLANGNYVVASPGWDRGVTDDAGAVTWRPGTGPFGGAITSGTSLVGSHANDGVGRVVVALSNGNYAVGSSDWDNGLVVDAGAAAWGNGDTGTVGPVSPANSLVGTTTDNRVGLRIAALANGNYASVARSGTTGGRSTSARSHGVRGAVHRRPRWVAPTACSARRPVTKSASGLSR